MAGEFVDALVDVTFSGFVSEDLEGS
jgi:hypothetical protein